MEYKNLSFSTKKGIVILTINRPKALNALNKQTMDELQHFFEVSAPRRKKMKGVVITGSGDRAFVAGADINEFMGMDSHGGYALGKRGQHVMFLIERFPKPVIAAVNGFALGGGCELAMACHMRVAGERAKFGQPEVNLGLIPGYGGTQRMCELVGRGRANEILMTGDMIDANEAYRIGLANHVVAPGEEINKSIEIINKIAAKAPIAISKVIESVEAYYNGVVDGYEIEAEGFEEACGTKDFQEGAGAFLGKRKPEFKGE